jgi:hypothetical protein
MKAYIVNQEGFVIDPDTGEVIDDISYRLDYTSFHDSNPYEILSIKRIERTVKINPKYDTKKYLSSLLPRKVREEFLSRVSNVTKKAELFAHFLVFCREYGIIYNFDEIREQLGISKITLRKVRKKITMQKLVKPWERVDPIFFQISEEIDKKNWLPAVLLAIEYERRGERISIDEIKKHLIDRIDEELGRSNYLKYLIRNGRYSILGVYRYFVCHHGRIARIDYRKKKKEFRVGHQDGSECFYVSEKKVLKIISKMELHYEAVKNSTQNVVQLP